MKAFTQNSISLLPAYLLLFFALALSFSALAQDEEVTVTVSDHGNSRTTKTINIEENNGEKTVTVTTKKDGTVNIEKYTGNEAEEFLLQEKDAIKQGSHSINVHKFDVVNTEGVDHIEMENIDVNVTDEDGVTKIEMSFTDDHGKKVQKVMVINEKEIEKSIEQITDLLDDLDINIDMDIEFDDEDKDETILVTKKVVSSNRSSSSMFKEMEICNSSSSGNLDLSLSAVNKDKVSISILDMKGNVLFVDSFNGKSTYKKSINLGDYNGQAMIKLEQGDQVEMRKVTIK